MRLPTSPWNYKQEVYQHDPWQMLIVCMMLNLTSYIQVDRIREVFFSRFPTPQDLIDSEDSEIIEIIRPLGFYNKRCAQWKKFSRAWITNNWKKIEDLQGVGKYAADSWKIFQEGNIDIQVEDKELIKYVEWAREYRELQTKQKSKSIYKV